MIEAQKMRAPHIFGKSALCCGLALAALVPIGSAHASSFTVLYAFTGGSDGANPLAGLIADGAGNLYGTTYAGGATQNGTVFTLTPDGTESVLHSFGGGSDGNSPMA